jgi:tetratricopeptide (TPR) repeat protein
MTLFGQRIDLGCVFLAGLTGLLLACGPTPRPPEVEYSGCRIVSVPGPVCSPFRTNRQLKLWVKVEPGSEAEIRVDGKRLAGNGEEAPGGHRFRVQLPSRASLLTIRLRQRDGRLGPPWSLTLVPPGAPEWEDEIGKLQADPGKSAQLRQRLAELKRGVPRNEKEYLFRPLGLQAHADGHDDEAAPWLEQGILVDQGGGMLSEEVDKATRLAGIYMDDRRFAEARKTLKNLTIPAGAPADSLFLVAYAQGLLANRVGDYGSALEDLQQASDLAERGGMDTYRLEAGQVLARVYEELGRTKEEEDLFTRLHAIPPPHSMTLCDQGNFLTNEAWSQLLAREAGEKADDPTPMLRQAQTDFDQSCGSPEQRLTARLNLALAAQQANRRPEAQQALNDAEPLASHATLGQRLWWLDLKGRQAIAEKKERKALDLYDQLATVARDVRSIEGSFRAAVGRANAQLKLGRPEEALVSFKEADGLIDEQTLHIPASEGRDTFLGQRESAVRRYLQLLLDRGHQQEAFELARRDRSRLLRQLEVKDRLTSMTPAQQQQWDEAMSKYWGLHVQVDDEAAREDLLPGDELKKAMESQAKQLDEARKELDRAMSALGGSGNREESPPSPPGPGEVILAYHPLPKGWVGFAATPDGIDPQISFFDLPDDVLADPGADRFREALAAKLIGPFRSVLERAARVRVLPFGPLRSVDFHTLPLAGKPLMDWLPVVYGLDVPTHLSPAPVGSPVALLVADPEDNLREARKESESVEEAIRGQGWTPKLLKGKEASVGAVRDALPGASLFEFAGHGELRGFAGWESALRLADGSRLTSRDVLTLRVPAWVVLSTCEGGRSSKEAPGEGIGLAQAFLLAGSQAVVAAVRPVLDSTAREFVADLHQYWKPGTDLVQPFRRAQQACLQRYADCASFRLFEP